MFNTWRYLIIVVLLLGFYPLLAQQDTGLITGQVLDESGSPSRECFDRDQEHRDRNRVASQH